MSQTLVDFLFSIDPTLDDRCGRALAYELGDVGDMTLADLREAVRMWKLMHAVEHDATVDWKVPEVTVRDKAAVIAAVPWGEWIASPKAKGAVADKMAAFLSTSIEELTADPE